MLLNRSRGELGGKPFAQHCSCPAVLRCSVHRTRSFFLGTIFVWEKWLPPYPLMFFLQTEYASYTSRSGRASLRSRRSAGREFFLLQKQTFQKLWPLRALEFEARLLLPSFIFQNKNLSSRSACSGQRNNLPPGNFIFQTPLRQLSKVWPASQTLVFEKQSSLRVYRFSENRCIIKP